VREQAPTTAYESLRAAVLDGLPHREGFAAIRFHGMLHGLRMFVQTAAPQDGRPSRDLAVAGSLPTGNEFIRQLANLVLRTHSELAHVY